jgi:putative Mg2+ transporter-C (MgtC) family protein
MPPVTAPGSELEAVGRLALAVVLGGALGLNRELHQKPAGLRTHALVSLGAALATLAGLALTTPAGGLDVGGFSRVLQGIIAGVGFIGGGVILHRDDTQGVHGLTTAASIWVVAAVGIACASGLWLMASAGVVLTLAALTLGEPIDRSLRRRARQGEPRAPDPGV